MLLSAWLRVGICLSDEPSLNISAELLGDGLSVPCVVGAPARRPSFNLEASLHLPRGFPRRLWKVSDPVLLRGNETLSSNRLASHLSPISLPLSFPPFPSSLPFLSPPFILFVSISSSSFLSFFLILSCSHVCVFSTLPSLLLVVTAFSPLCL